MLRGCLLVGLWLWTTFCGKVLADSAIGIENRRAGTREWWRSQEDERMDERAHILGFATRLSVLPGTGVEFKFESSSCSGSFELRIYRLGYYGGLGGRLVHEVAVPAQKSTKAYDYSPHEEGLDCDVLDREAHLVDCSGWNACLARWMVPSDAVTGVYVAVPFINGQIRGTYIPVVVLQPAESEDRASKRGSDILFKTSDLTWVAYNMYGGWNLYTRRNDSKRSFYSRARAVSYNRPFTNRFNQSRGGKHQNFLLGSEYAALRWLEKYGYDVSYATCFDIEEYDRLGYFSEMRFKSLISVGHDEYWTLAMKRAFENARNHGTHLLFWSGNEMFWRVKWWPRSSNDTTSPHVSSPPRIIIAKKETIDGQRENGERHDWTGTFGDKRLQTAPEPENALTGQLFAVNGLRHDAIQVHAGENRLRFWRNTTLSANLDMIFTYESPRGLLGYEWDVFSDDCSRPPGLVGLSTTRKIISNQLVHNYGAAYNGTGEVVHRLTFYRHVGIGGRTSLVFGAGTVQWAWGLSSWHDGVTVQTDNNMQQASVNILADMGVQPGRELENLHDAGASSLMRETPSTDAQAPASHILHPSMGKQIDVRRNGVLRVAGTARDYGGGRVAGVEVSIDGGTTWRFANGTYNWVYHHHFRGRDFSLFCHVEGTSTHAWLLANDSSSSLAGSGHLTFITNILSRAFDDSGNIEMVEQQLKKVPRRIANKAKPALSGDIDGNQHHIVNSFENHKSVTLSIMI